MTTIYVVDDHPLIRDAVAMVLRRLRAGQQIVELDRLDKLVSAVATHGQPGLIVLDLNLPDTAGASGVYDVRRRFSKVPFAVYSASPAADYERICLAAGADIYIEKDAGIGELSTALRALLVADEQPFDIDSGTGELTPVHKLSKRQKQLIIMLEQGLSNKEMALELCISEHTVKVHLWRLFRKLDVKSRMQAIHFARANGLLQS